MRYRFTVDGSAFRSARAAHAYVTGSKSHGQPCLIRVNGEPLTLDELRREAAAERAERQHNKRQGL